MRYPFFFALFALAPSEILFGDNLPLRIEKAWIQAVPAVSEATAAYMKITNLSAGPVKLTGASSPVAAEVEPMITTRETRAGQQIMGMQSVNELVIPPGGSLELKPGGNHLMIMGLKTQLKEGDSMKITVRFAPGEQRLDLEIPVCKEEPK
jgi:periplasmic copper chaperone A